MSATKLKIDNINNINTSKFSESKLDKIRLSSVVFTALTTLYTVLASPSFAEKNLTSDALVNNTSPSETIKSIDGEKVAGYFDNGYSGEFNSSIYKLRDTVSDCRELDTRIRNAIGGKQIMPCNRFKLAVEQLDDASKNAINNPTDRNIQLYKVALLNLRDESTRLLGYVRNSFQEAYEYNQNDKPIYNALTLFNSKINERNSATTYFKTLLNDGVLGYVDTGFANIPKRFGQQRREFVQRNANLYTIITTNDIKGVLKLIKSTIFNN